MPFPEPIRLTPELRKKLETAVDQILTLLDATAPDPDLEPSLGAPENHGQHPWRYGAGDQTRWADGLSDDLEEEADGSEPSLGWTATIKQDGFGWSGGRDDAEGEHDGREPQGDEEAYLAGSDTDLEDDPAERSGIADAEGASEQGLPTGGHFSHVE